MTEEEITRSSGNVFADLDVPHAEDELLKARLAVELRRLIQQNKLTQKAAAERMGISQPDVSNLVRGRISGFSLERLFHFVRALGKDVEVKITDARHGEGRLVFHSTR
jgi:predicted XRE-type DNA-binding protein